MSGLFAVWNRDREPVAESLVRNAARLVEARAGVAASVWRQGEVALLGAGSRHAPSQCRPLVDRRGEIRLVADARIDNREALLRELDVTPKADAPRDGQLILAAYRKWGSDFARRLRGDFAIVIWDRPAATLLLARDPFGVKPLHVHVGRRLICVASEGRQVLTHPGVPDEIDWAFVGTCLLDLHEDRELSPYAAVRRLAPGHLLNVDRENVAQHRFWTPEGIEPIRFRTDAESAERFRELFDRAVASRSRDSGGVVGIQLSGGLDSTSVAASSALIGGGDGRFEVAGMTAEFPRGSSGDESRYLELLTARTGIEIVRFDAAGETLVDRDESGQVDAESPFVGWAVERRMVRALTDRESRVMLTGHGGDSLCFGSPLVYADLFRAGRLGRLIGELREHARRRGVGMWPLFRRYVIRATLPGSWIRGAREFAGRPSEALVPNWMSRDFARRHGLDRLLASSRALHGGRRTAREDLRYNAVHLGVVGEAVYWLDRLGARHGIEVRHPFLDLDLVEFLLAVEPERSFRAGWGKRLLRDSMVGRLPDGIRRRFDKASTGFFWRDRLRGAEWSAVEALLEEPLLLRSGLIDGPALVRELRRFRQGQPSTLDGCLWRMLCVELWLRRRSMIQA